MSSTVLRPTERSLLRAQAHALSPVVMIGDAGLSRAVIAEIERALVAHQLIKIRVLGDDRAQRLTLLEDICHATGAAPVQQIGKLLIVYRKPGEDAAAAAARRPPAKTPAAKKGAARSASAREAVSEAPRRNPVSGRIMVARPASKKAAKGPAARPPRTERVRKSGQKSTKKAFQAR